MHDYYDYHPLVHLERPLALVGLSSEPARSLGHWLASTEGLPVIDLDRRVEHQAGRSIRSPVRTAGEPAYRALEHDTLRAAVRATPPSIIVGSDGTALDPDNRALLTAHTHWVALVTVPPPLANVLSAAAAMIHVDQYDARGLRKRIRAELNACSASADVSIGRLPSA